MKSRKVSIRLPVKLYDFIRKEAESETVTISKWMVMRLEEIMPTKEQEMKQSRDSETSNWPFILIFIIIIAFIYHFVRNFSIK